MLNKNKITLTIPEELKKDLYNTKALDGETIESFFESEELFGEIKIGKHFEISNIENRWNQKLKIYRDILSYSFYNFGLKKQIKKDLNIHGTLSLEKELKKIKKELFILEQFIRKYYRDEYFFNKFDDFTFELSMFYNGLKNNDSKAYKEELNKSFTKFDDYNLKILKLRKINNIKRKLLEDDNIEINLINKLKNNYFNFIIYIYLFIINNYLNKSYFNLNLDFNNYFSIISKYSIFNIFLNGLTSISEKVAQELKEFKGDSLYLNGLTNIKNDDTITEEKQEIKDFITEYDAGACLVSGYRGVGKTSTIKSSVVELREKSEDEIIEVIINIPEQKKDKNGNVESFSKDELITKIIREIYLALVNKGFKGKELEIFKDQYIRTFSNVEEVKGYLKVKKRNWFKKFLINSFLYLVPLYFSTTLASYIETLIIPYLEYLKSLCTLGISSLYDFYLILLNVVTYFLNINLFGVSFIEIIFGVFSIFLSGYIGRVIFNLSFEGRLERQLYNEDIAEHKLSENIGSFNKNKGILQSLPNFKDIFKFLYIVKLFKNRKRKLVIVIDELDKLLDFEKESGRSKDTKSILDMVQIFDVLGKLKTLFFETTGAIFFVVTNKQAYDYYLTNKHQEDDIISNIFNKIIYIPGNSMDNFNLNMQIDVLSDSIKNKEEKVNKKLNEEKLNKKDNKEDKEEINIEKTYKRLNKRFNKKLNELKLSIKDNKEDKEEINKEEKVNKNKKEFNFKERQELRNRVQKYIFFRSHGNWRRSKFELSNMIKNNKISLDEKKFNFDYKFYEFFDKLYQAFDKNSFKDLKKEVFEDFLFSLSNSNLGYVTRLFDVGKEYDIGTINIENKMRELEKFLKDLKIRKDLIEDYIDIREKTIKELEYLKNEVKNNKVSFYFGYLLKVEKLIKDKNTNFNNSEENDLFILGYLEYIKDRFNNKDNKFGKKEFFGLFVGSIEKISAEYAYRDYIMNYLLSIFESIRFLRKTTLDEILKNIKINNDDLNYPAFTDLMLYWLPLMLIYFSNINPDE